MLLWRESWPHRAPRPPVWWLAVVALAACLLGPPGRAAHAGTAAQEVAPADAAIVPAKAPAPDKAGEKVAAQAAAPVSKAPPAAGDKGPPAAASKGPPAPAAASKAPPAPAAASKAPPAPAAASKAPPPADKAPPAPAPPEKAPAPAVQTPEPPAGELEPPPRVPLGVFAYDVPGADPDVATRLEAAVAAALRPDRRLGIIDLRDVLDPVEPGQVSLSKVQEHLEQARTLIDTKRAPSAEKVLDAAVATLQRELGHVGVPEAVADTLREALGLQASVAFIGGDKARAMGLLQAVYNIDRRLRWVSRLFPESMKDYIEEVRPQIINASRGSLVLGATPGGALIFVGGKKVGQGKATVEGLPPGTHFVTWVRRNRRALTSRVVVQPGQSTELTPALPRYGSDDPVARLEAAEGQVGKSDMPLGAAEAAATLRADLLVLLRAQAPEKGAAPPGGGSSPAGTLRVTACLYDRRLRTLLKEVHQPVSPEAPERDAGKLVAALFKDAKLDGAPKLVEKPPPPPAAPPPTGIERISRSRWFWPVVGVVAGAVLTGVVVDIAVRSR